MFPSFANSLMAALGLVAATAFGQVVINELHYDPDDNTKAIEFVELHNAGLSEMNVGGWHLEDGADYIIPPNTTIAAGGYLVLAQNPTAFAARFGFVPLGPWAGRLSADGERLQLRDGNAALVDEVTYGSGFPWPTAARGGGKSMELIHPSLDNDLAGSWRSSGADIATQTLIAAGDGQWHWRPGTSEASNPITAWRTFSFIEDETWSGNAPLPIGYGDIDGNGGNTDVATTISGMQNVYRSVFLRRTFTINPGQMPPTLKLRVRCDDGCIVWINGVEISPRVRVDATAPTYNAAGMAIGNATEPPLAWESDISIVNAQSILQVGTNVIAIQVFNTSLNSSDLFLDAELLAAAPDDGTPGAQNSVYSANAPPAIRQLAHVPEQPSPGVPVVVSAKITDPQGVASATLSYQLVDPGSYIRKVDTTYATTWTNLAMLDNGTGGDAVAGDGTFTVTLPGTLQTHRRMVRYRISASDGATAITVPYSDDEQPNFAYFVYGGPPGWTARNQPPSGPTTAFPSTLITTLPIYHLLTNETDVLNSQYNNAFDTQRMWGTLVYDGKVYDHILYHNKGAASTYQSGKNKWRFHFNRARDFEARDSWGKKYKQSWDTFTMHACASPWNPCFRGWAGLDEVISTRVYQLAGVPSPNMHHLNLRVIRRALESATPGVSVSDPFGPSGTLDGQYSNDSWGLYMAVEDPDGSFLDERGLPDGNVYHIAGNAGDKTHQGATHPVTTSDWDAFRAGSQANTANNATNETWWRANLDVTAYASFHAGNRITGNVDLREGWNHYFYRRGTDNRWVPIPWDLDMMYFPETHWSGTIDQKNSLLMTNISTEAKSRFRELLDLICEDGTATGGQIGQLVDEYRRVVRPAGQPVGWDLLDQYMWNYHPRTTGGHTGRFYLPQVTTDNRIGGTWTRTYSTADFLGVCNFLVNYATDTDPDAFTVGDGDQRGYGYNYLELEATDAAIPNRPTITFIGTAGFPANDLRFNPSAFADPQGAGTFAAMQWRIGEISAPGVGPYIVGEPFKYEATDVFRSPEITTVASSYRYPVTACEPGRVYRARVRYKDNTNRWSRWSAAVQFTAGTPDVSVYTSSLVVSEVNYNPAPVTSAEFAAGFSSDDFEWIEVKNVSGLPVDFTGLRFTKGVDFDFPNAWSVPAGGFALVVKNLAAFQMRWGHAFDAIIAGSYGTDNLSNGGEQVKLSYGVGTPVVDFTYADSAPWPAAADGTGKTLSLNTPNTLPDPTIAANWKASYAVGGSPGADDLLTFDAWRSGYIGVTSPLANNDYDALVNLLEYAFAADPTFPSPTALPTRGVVTLGALGDFLTITFTRQADAIDLAIEAQFSTGPGGAWLANGILVSVNASGNTVTETWRAPASIAAEPRQFARVQVVKQ
jgi:hypothetical protein